MRDGTAQDGLLATRPLAVALAIFAPTLSHAQTAVFDATAIYSVSVREVDRITGAPSSATPGFIDPSEAVRLTFAVSFTPLVGAVATYTPPIPGPGTGTVVGWASSTLRLIGIGGTDGIFGSVVVAPGFVALTPFPEPGGLSTFGAWSPAIAFNTPGINATNPVDPLVELTWTPTNDTPRSISFRTATPVGLNQPAQRIGLYIEPPGGSPTTMSSWVLDGRTTHADTGPIVIVPAPAALPLVLAALALPRRRRATKSLTADDDDANLGNGTPNDDIILSAFASHNIP
ncbi:MAG: hypothetical protein ACKVW3_14820 [Phycisphaerales bacterium]